MGIFWAGRPEEDTKSKIDPWLEDCYKTKQDLVIDDLHYAENTYKKFGQIDNKMTEQVDLREVIKKKAEKHSRYYRSLYTHSSSILDVNSKMAPHVLERSTKVIQTALHERERTDKNKQNKSRHRRIGVYEMTDDYESDSNFKSVKKMCEKYQSMMIQTDKQLKEEKVSNTSPKDVYLIPPVSGYCSSSASAGSDDEKERNWYTPKGHSEVRRCGSSDSAVGLTPSDEEVSNINAEITDINLRWTDVYEKSDTVNLTGQLYSPYSPRGSIDHVNVPTKTIIEAQYFSLPLNRKLSDCPSDIECDKNESRRQSCFTDDGDEQTRYRFWRTPSVVVSDYSDDVVGFTLEDIEYFRNQRKDTSSSPDSSLHSSCSNLNYCGSTISSLDAEYILRKPLRKGSDCSTCSTLSGDEGDADEGQFQSFPRQKVCAYINISLR